MKATAHEIIHYIVRWSDTAKNLAYEGLFLFTKNLSETYLESEMGESGEEEERSWGDM